MSFARSSEKAFSLCCSEAGAIAHPPDEDANGWDFMVEFSTERHAGPSDMQPAAAKAFVQIKSTVGTKTECRVKLSNALKAAQSPLPWFIVLYTKAPAGKPRWIYIKHIWREEIEQTLERVRRVESADATAALHRHFLTIRFNAAEKVNAADIVGHMSASIRSAGPDYYSAKQTILRTAGFDEGFGVGTFSLAGEENEIIDSFLGLGRGLPGSDINFRLARFGIVDRQPLFELQNATVFITPTPVGSAEFRLRGGNPPEAMSIACDVYCVGEPILAGEKRRFRFSGAGIEVLWSADGYSRFTFNLDFQMRVPLPEFDRLATLMHWNSTGPIDLQVWAFGRRALGGVLNDDKPRSPSPWDRVSKISRLLLSLAGTKSAAELQISAKELNEAGNRLWFMVQVVTGPSLLMQCGVVIEPPIKIDKLLYYVTATVGSLTAFAVIERRVLQDRTLSDGKTEFTCGHANIRESWIVCDATTQNHDMMESDYNHIASAANSECTLSIGDIYQVYAQGKKTSN